MSSLRLSYASSPESDLEHSPGPPVSPGLSGSGSNTGIRLTKASSDPSVVMPDTSTNDVLPPYQVSLSIQTYVHITRTVVIPIFDIRSSIENGNLRILETMDPN